MSLLAISNSLKRIVAGLVELEAAPGGPVTIELNHALQRDILHCISLIQEAKGKYREVLLSDDERLLTVALDALDGIHAGLSVSMANGWGGKAPVPGVRMADERLAPDDVRVVWRQRMEILSSTITRVETLWMERIATRRNTAQFAGSIESSAPKPAEPESPAQVHAKLAGVTFKVMTWQKAMKAAEEHCARNPFPGVRALAKIVGCSPSTMSKAIDRSSKLRSMLVEHEAGRRSVSAVAMTERAAASTVQTREPDPIDAAAASTDDRFHRLLEQAKPSERARLNAMTPARRRELVATIDNDPDTRGRRWTMDVPQSGRR